LFLGDHVCAVDVSSHVSLPTRFQDLLTGRIYITQGFERNLIVMPSGMFEEIYRQISRLNAADPLARLFTRLFLGTASELAVEENGQILIPERLREFAHLEEKAIVVGQGNFFEIWSPMFWSDQTNEINNVNANSNRFAGFNLVISH